jgi:hypothetical protein
LPTSRSSIKQAALSETPSKVFVKKSATFATLATLAFFALGKRKLGRKT